MDRYDLLYKLYDEFDTDCCETTSGSWMCFHLSIHGAFEHYQEIDVELEDQKDAIRDEFQEGETLTEIAAHIACDEAFTALDFQTRHDRVVELSRSGCR